MNDGWSDQQYDFRYYQESWIVPFKDDELPELFYLQE